MASTKNKTPFLKRLAIYAVLALFPLLLFQPSVFSKWTMDLWSSLGFSFLLFVVLSEGNGWIVERLELLFPWNKGPKKRFFLSLFCILIYSIPAVIVITTITGYLFWGFKLEMIYSSKFYNHIVITMLITAIVSLLIFSLSFLDKWQELAEELEQRKNKALYAQIETLQNQIKPHFLFNNLNAVTSIIPKDPDKAIQFIYQLANVYRYILDHQQEELVPLETEIAFAESYVFLMEIRYKNRLQITWDVPSNKGNVPPYVLQLLLENAIKHNVISKHKPLRIRLERKGDILLVSNNLQTKKAEGASWGIGLKNIKERYQLLSDKTIVVREDAKSFTVEVPVLNLAYEPNFNY